MRGLHIAVGAAAYHLSPAKTGESMRTNFVTFALAASVVASPAFALTAADVLAANKQASGGKAWDGKATLTLQYDYVGQGMTGKVESTADLGTGHYLDSYKIG